MKAIILKELRYFWVTPYGVVFLSSFLFLSGVTTSILNLFNRDTHYETTTLQVLPWFLFFLIPLLSMRSFSEERQSSTLVLLYTNATSLWEAVLAKFIAACSMLFIALLVTVIYPVIYDIYSYVNWQSIASAYLGLMLLGSVYIALGIWASSISSSQAGAAALSFFALLFLYLLGVFLPRLPQSAMASLSALVILGFLALLVMWRNGLSWLPLLISAVALALLFFALGLWQPVFLQGLLGRASYFFSPLQRFASFSRGLIRAADLLYYLSSCGLFLLITTLSLEKKRWH